jgi:hypothetical protein
MSIADWFVDERDREGLQKICETLIQTARKEFQGGAEALEAQEFGWADLIIGKLVNTLNEGTLIIAGPFKEPITITLKLKEK